MGRMGWPGASLGRLDQGVWPWGRRCHLRLGDPPTRGGVFSVHSSVPSLPSFSTWSPGGQALCPRPWVGNVTASALVLSLVPKRETVNRQLECSVY